MAKDDWTTVRLPNELHEQIKELVKRRKSGYRTIAQFVNEAVRLRLEGISKFETLTQDGDEDE